MAKDSFFIRASLDIPAGGSGDQVAIDLGAYVDALGSSILKIHNIQVQYLNTASVTDVISNSTAGGNSQKVSWQLTTQSQASLVKADNRSLISSGSLTVGADAAVRNYYETQDVNVQEWTNGYTVAVEQMYLRGYVGGNTDPTTVTLVMECTVEKMTASSAMALALSQQ